MGLPIPPRKTEPRFDDWVILLWKQLTGAKTTDTQATVAGSSHEDLTNLNSTDFSHLSASEKSELLFGGSTSLHFHQQDRARANHTGVQLSSSIADFRPAVLGAVWESGQPYIYLPTIAGAPSATPMPPAGTVAAIYDITNNKLYVYNGSWKSVTLS